MTSSAPSISCQSSPVVDWNGGVQRGGRLTVSASVSASSNQARLQHKLRLITVGAGSACTGGQRGRSMKYHQPVYRDLGKFPCLSPISNCKIGFPRPPVLAHSGVPRLFLAADLVPVPLTTAQPTLTHHSLPLPRLVVGRWVGGWVTADTGAAAVTAAVIVSGRQTDIIHRPKQTIFPLQPWLESKQTHLQL